MHFCENKLSRNEISITYKINNNNNTNNFATQKLYFRTHINNLSINQKPNYC